MKASKRNRMNAARVAEKMAGGVTLSAYAKKEAARRAREAAEYKAQKEAAK